MNDIVDRLRNATALTRKDLLPLCSDALDEIERLRALITAWADAYESIGVAHGGTEDEVTAYWATHAALRKAVGR